MKRNFAKVLSLVLALAMIAGSFATVVYAEDTVACPGKDNRHTLHNTPNYELVKEYKPVCDKDGYTSYKCLDCGILFVDSYVVAEDTAHSWGEVIKAVAPDCTTDGTKAYQQCAKCGDYLIDGERYDAAAGEKAIVVPAIGHKYEKVGATGTCLDKGVQTWACVNCGDTYTVDVEGTGEGHKWVLVSVDVYPSVDENGETVPGVATYECSVCKETTTFPVDCAHDEKVEIPAVDPTCTETGLTAGAACSVCGFITDAQEVVDALGHTEVIDEAVAPTCSTTGLTAGRHCAVCGDADETFYIAQEELAPDHCVGSVPVEFDGVVGDCATKEVKPGTKCSICGETWTEPEELDYVHDVYDVVVDPTCTTAGFTAKYCRICEEMIGVGEVISALGHTENLTWDYAVENVLAISKVEATCEIDGQYTYYCENGCGHVMTVVIPATQHSIVNVEIDATCNMLGYTYSYCTNGSCDYAPVTEVTVNGVVYSIAVEGASVNYAGDIVVDVEGGLDADNHTALEILTVVQEATCTEAGHAITYCADCNHTDLQHEIEALGHSWTRGEGATVIDVVAPTCTEAGWTEYQCLYCDATAFNLNEGDAVAATGHNSDTVVPGYPATCLVDGLTDGANCSVCGTIQIAQEVIRATGHNLTFVQTYAPKCDGTKGYDEYSCDKTGCDNGGVIHNNYTEYVYVSTDYYASVEEANKIHSLDLTSEKVLRELSCGIDGLIQYTCAECEKEVVILIPKETNHNWVEDAEVPADCLNAGVAAGKTCSLCGAKEGYEPIDALGHDFATEWSYNATKHWYDCSRCDVVDAEAEHVYSYDVTLAPTCLEEGVGTYTCDCGHFYTAAIEALGHDFATEWTNDEINHWYDCSRCDVNYATANHIYTVANTILPTCTETGLDTYTCVDCGYTYTEEVAALGHNFEATGATSVLGCITDQYVEYACTRCNIYELRNYLPALGHTEVIDEAVAPDCDDTGLTEGRHCAVCGDADENYYIAQEIIDATGIHKNSDGDILEDSCLDTNENRVCVECGETVGQTHGEDIEVTYAPTCVNVGYTTRVCLACGEEITEPTNVKAPTGIHSFGEWYETIAPTCTETGVQQRDCEYCDAYETDEIAATGHSAGDYDNDDAQHWIVCEDCGVELENTRVNHKWTVKEVVAVPQPGVPGETIYECVCGAEKTEYPAFEGIKVSFDTASGIYDGDVIVNGGLVILNVYIEGTEANVENIQIKLNYDADRLTYVSQQFYLFEHTYANFADGNGTIFLHGAEGEMDSHSAVTINGKVLVAQITFRVDDYADVLAPEADVDATTTTFSFVEVSALTPDGDDEDTESDVIGARFEDATLDVTVEKLGAISANDKCVGLNDATAIMDLVYDSTAEYNARADINKDGYVDAFDYIYLAKYLGGIYSYTDIVGIDE